MNEGVVNLLVETIENKDGDKSMVISKSALNPEQTVRLIQFLTEKLSEVSGIAHDEVLEDLKYKDEE